MPSDERLPPNLSALRSERELARLSRGDVLRLMRRGVREPWLREAFEHAHPSDLVILGRFDLIGGDGRVPHPSVCARIVRRVSRPGQVTREGVLGLYMDEGGEWVVESWGSAPWGQYAGDSEGEPSVFNGDRPGEARRADGPASP